MALYHAKFRNEFSFFFLSTPEQCTIFSEELDSELICLRNAELLAIQWP